MLQYTNNYSDIYPQSDVEILKLQIQRLENELSDLRFEFKRAYQEFSREQ